MAERDDLIPELGIGSQHPVIAVTMDAWRVNESGEPFEELERSERESRGTIRCGMWETIDDALASTRAVPCSLEPFEGEGRTGTVTQESFEPSTVVGRNVVSLDGQEGPRPPRECKQSANLSGLRRRRSLFG